MREEEISTLKKTLSEHDERIDAARQLLPAWFVPRMMDDNWVFGLLLANGKTLVIEQIDEVRQAGDGSIWIDATMYQGGRCDVRDWNLVYTPTSRSQVSINVAHVILALELADT